MDNSCFEEYKPAVAMVVVQCIYAALAISSKAVFTEGMSPMVFVVYRQAIATLVLFPTTIVARGCSFSQLALGMRGFALVFLASLIGATMNQYFYYKGVDLADPSIATAMINIIPAITFVMAVSIGLEKLKLRSMRSAAKVLGTIVCVGGAIFMAFFKGPELRISEHLTSTSILHSLGGNQWLTGCFYLIGSTFCWSLWLILQVPICERYLDPLSLSVWMCILATIQSAILVLITLGPGLDVWKINSIFELSCCLFAGIFGSGVTFVLQSWSISIRGPLYSAMFNPLNAVIATMVSILILHEELHVGSLVGAIAIVVGLYIVLWGKAKDFDTTSLTNPRDDGSDMSESLLEESQLVKRHSSYSLI